MSRILLSFPFAGLRERLARIAARDDVDIMLLRIPFDFSDVPEVRHVRPMFEEDFCRVFVDF